MDTAETPNVQPPPGAHTRSNPTFRSASNNSQTPNQTSIQSHGSQQPDGSSFNSSLSHQPSWIRANTFDLGTTQHHVLFLVKRGDNYRLAQICVGDMSANTFFGSLKEEYFRLRGVLRGWFSIWRFSHCEFYKASTPIV